MSPAALRSAADDPSIQRRFFANSGRFLPKAVQGRKGPGRTEGKKEVPTLGFVATSTLEDPRHVAPQRPGLRGISTLAPRAGFLYLWTQWTHTDFPGQQ